MKKIIYSLIGLALLFCFSCTETDNYDGPDAQMSGKLIDKTTGENFITGQGEFNIRIWEMSWSDNPGPQDIPVKQDGTFNDSKLFSATYDMQPYGGPFWPAERQTDIKLSGHLQKDFEVIPYLQIVDFTYSLDGNNLTVSCKLKAPITENLPKVLEIKPFVSLTQYCGEGNRISEYDQYKDGARYYVKVEQNWWDGVGPMELNAVSYNTYTPETPLPLKSGRTYYVRMGVRVEDTYKKYNYSPIVKIDVP